MAADMVFASGGVIPISSFRNRLCKPGPFPLRRDKLCFYSSSVLVNPPARGYSETRPTAKPENIIGYAAKTETKEPILQSILLTP